MEAIRSSETSVLIRATRRHLPEDDNHHSHRRGNLKSYKNIEHYNLHTSVCTKKQFLLAYFPDVPYTRRRISP
jgi:hypothetical protein